ncbi:MAG: hypothetical protein Q4B75_02525 [Eubacteriales bacterium]|nr:hypothetical protein [Eubacteriales bacterium]
MQNMEKKKITLESEQQLKAIKTIGRWRTYAIALSAVGVALAYYGFQDGVNHLSIGIPGILLIAAGFAGATILNLGIKNGKRNVEKMLRLLEEDRNAG